MTAIITDDPTKLPIKQIAHARLVLHLQPNGQLIIAKNTTGQLNMPVDDLDHLIQLLK